ncbi:S-adenosyl-L-methionine-dependent methyltransferase [Aulographum hederae CBS 113979]|uniref:S-adenosyl-L-methionine-dependent methyltransferase n=1 Tax=Aulographum hederae CBS 113979 TaxID=1176131 RepID=A0A6G1GNJ6_9PEZI|nr:S-adenosyl-L-methionine-dependent methyltransferase [Aulographum hederae CBS 113979]
MSRPEDLLPPDLYYNDSTSRSYTTSSRIKNIQAEMTYRALALLNLQSPSLILDVGCGSGLSGAILSSQPNAPQLTNPGGPHTWIGCDISASMLAVALENDSPGDLFLADAGQGIPFRPGTFDACISISAIQWLCNAESSIETPQGRLKRFFDGLYVSLRRGGKAVLQFYPKDASQKKMISDAAVRAGFGAGLLEDSEGTKSAKTYLVLNVGGGDILGAVNGMEGVDVDERRAGKGKGSKKWKKGKPNKGSKAWILGKKEQMEKKGMVVKPTSKYTGRRRKTPF